MPMKSMKAKKTPRNVGKNMMLISKDKPAKMAKPMSMSAKSVSVPAGAMSSRR